MKEYENIYEFKHIGLDGNGGKMEIVVSTEAEHIDDLVNAFRSFLLACTFHNTTILNGMASIIDEHSEEE